MTPKKSGKNTATKGVGSTLPYRGGASKRKTASKGRTSRGLRNTTGASSVPGPRRHISSTTTSPSNSSCNRVRIPASRSTGTQPSTTNAWRVAPELGRASSSATRSRKASRACASSCRCSAASSSNCRRTVSASPDNSARRSNMRGTASASVPAWYEAGTGISCTRASRRICSTRLATRLVIRISRAASPVGSRSVRNSNSSPTAARIASVRRGTTSVSSRPITTW